MNKKQGASEENTDSELIKEVLEQVSESEKVESTTIDLEAVEKELETQADGEDNNADIEEIAEEISPEDLQKQVKQAQKKAEENWDKAVRVQAEMENLKRRTMKDLENAHKYGLEKFAKELLSVIDSLELGIQASSSDSPEVVAGIELTIKQFESVFAKFNIEAINPVGQAFNPELHQAMTIVPSADVEPNSVLNVFQKGYTFNGRLLRPAMVVVSKAIKPPEDLPNKPEGDSINLDEQA